jgi:hypothetical protein
VLKVQRIVIDRGRHRDYDGEQVAICWTAYVIDHVAREPLLVLHRGTAAILAAWRQWFFGIWRLKEDLRLG